MRRIAGLVILLITLLLPIQMQGQVNQAQMGERDTLKMSRDSIIHLVRIKDSLINLARRDSMAMAHLIHNLEFNRDSMNGVLNEILYKMEADSISRMNQYLRARDFNRRTKTAIKYQLGGIDEDSVRASLSDLVGLAFDDTAYSPKPKLLKSSMDRLVSHLDNDSLYFRIINAKQDTVPFVLKDNRVDSTAFFIMNSKQDSARIYMRSLNKHTIYMWVGDDLMLQQLLKKQATPTGIPIHWQGPLKYRVARRPVPDVPAKRWNKGAEFNFMVNQTALVNWAKGGLSNITLTTDLKAKANYAKGNLSWNNSFRFYYGVQKAELLNIRKSQDIINLTSSLNHKAFKNFDYTVSSTFDTQASKGYLYPNDSVPVSKFMAPGTLQLNLGLTYKPKPNFTIFASPVGGSLRFVLDTVSIDETRWGLKRGQSVLPQFGARVTINHTTVLFKTVTMVNYLDLFSNYIDQPEKINFDWRLNLDLKVNKYITTAIKTQMIYDNKVMVPIFEIKEGKKIKVGEGKRVQFMEFLGISFKYTL